MRLPTRNEALRFVKGIAEKVGEGVRWFAVELGRGALYLCLFLSSVLSHILLLLLTVAPATLPILVVWILCKHWGAFIDCIHRIGQDAPIVQTLAFIIVGAGILGGIVMKMWNSAYKAVRKLWKAPAKVLRRGLSRGSDLEHKRQPLGPGRDNIAEIPGTVGKALTRVLRFTGALLVGVFVIATAYPLFARPVQTVDRYVAVVDTRDTDTETNQEIKLYMSTGAVFYLAHVEDAQPQSGEGICLGEPQRKWLDEFKKAIQNCMENTKGSEGSEPPVFRVTGYASIAPMHRGGDIDQSERLNCKVANWRAAAVGAYLTDPNPKADATRWNYCGDRENTFNETEPNETNKCGEHHEIPDQEGNPFRVKVHQWSEPSLMAKGRPADDGTRPDDRRFDVEILNRVVRIDVPDDFCRDAAQKATAAPYWHPPLLPVPELSPTR